jgi:endonuclease-8
VPEGDTIHRAARRIDVTLAGKEMALADAPSPRSPIHGKAKRLEGSTLERVEARGKHLIAHFSCDLAVHSHLGMNGRWFIAADGRMPYGKPWLVLASGRAIAAQSGGKLLRRMGAGLEIGDALLDQRIIAGIGNAIRNEALFRVGISPWRRVEDLTSDQIERIVRENERVMQISMTEGKRPRAIYRANRRGCPTCAGPISAQGQGDANRTAYWCPACQA